VWSSSFCINLKKNVQWKRKESVREGRFWITFKSGPSLFYQLFTIHSYHNEQNVRLVYCLLPNKLESTYEAAFWHLRLYLPADYSPCNFFADFERTIHLAVQKVWPLTKVLSCRFHLGQSRFQKIQSLGLQWVYWTHTGDGAFLRTYYIFFTQTQSRA